MSGRTLIACLDCETKFQPKRRDAKYCSAGCKQAAHRRRNSDGSCMIRLDGDVADELDPDTRAKLVNDLMRKHLFGNET